MFPMKIAMNVGIPYFQTNPFGLGLAPEGTAALTLLEIFS